MCGIVACRSNGPAKEYLLSALERLEYRGYDSAGMAVSADDGTLALLRTVGRLQSLRRIVEDYEGPVLNGTGIGHTRWATHGPVSVRNAHPHLSCDNGVAIVHNGIIHNAPALRQELEDAGHVFRSDVDSEVIAHLVEDGVGDGEELLDAVRRAAGRLTGSWAIAAVERSSNRVVVTAHRCPLIVGRSPVGDFAASDTAALLHWVDAVHVLRDDDVVELGTRWRWSGPEGPRAAPPSVVPAWRPDDVVLGSYPDFMAKEIAEQTGVAARIVDEFSGAIADGSLWGDLGLPAPARVRLLACGTSLNAGRLIGRVFESLGGVAVRAVVASEGANDLVEPNTITLAISQSGETADVLQALEHSESTPLVALTNNIHSSLARQASAVLNCHAGPEIGVAATKTFTAQVLVGVALALSGLVYGGQLTPRQAQRYVDLLAATPDRFAAAEQIVARELPAYIDSLSTAPGFLFLARGAGLPYAAEGALKLQEITYRWANAYPAGELKHGPIALIEQGTPVIAVDDGNDRLRLNLAEVSARGARVIDIGGPGAVLPLIAEYPIRPPWGPLESVVGLQHLARSVAVALGRDVDKPRNLAKSVTVE